MENTIDRMKADSLGKIRKSCKSLLIFSIFLLIFELISEPCTILYTIIMQKYLESQSEINAMNLVASIQMAQLGKLPEQIIRAVLIITSAIALIILLARIRKNESPFREENGKLLQFIAILNLIIPFVRDAAAIIRDKLDAIKYRTHSTFNYSVLFTPMAFNYWPIVDAVLLFFLAWVIRYGAVLQQQSDETL